MNKTNNQIIAVLSVIAIVLSGVALSKSNNSGAAQASDSLAKMQQTKKMKVCVAEWSPQSIKDPNTGKYSGVDIDILESIASEIGVTPEYHDTTFGNMPAAVQSGICDIGTSLYVKPSRAAVVNFTNPILFGGDSALVRKGDTRFMTIQDVNKPGIKVAVANGESGHIYAKNHFDKATIVPIDVASSDLSRFLLEVSSGRADIAISDSKTITNFAEQHADTQAIFVEKPFNLNPDGFVVRHDDDNLLDFLNQSLLTLRANNKINELFDKYNVHWYVDATEYKLR